jgi:hypothetical protein
VHWNLWTARSRRVGCSSMGARVIGLRHFEQVSFMNRSKDIVDVPRLILFERRVRPCHTSFPATPTPGMLHLGDNNGLVRGVIALALSRSNARALSPVASSTTEVSAATAEQQHQHNDNQDQFHGKSPLTAMALFATHRIL